MRDLNRSQGYTVVIVTHDIGVGNKTDRIIRMMDGEITEELRLAPEREAIEPVAAAT
jgi:ABC-type lipoprotein export system ATPase subunit